MFLVIDYISCYFSIIEFTLKVLTNYRVIICMDNNTDIKVDFQTEVFLFIYIAKKFQPHRSFISVCYIHSRIQIPFSIGFFVIPN